MSRSRALALAVVSVAAIFAASSILAGAREAGPALSSLSPATSCPKGPTPNPYSTGLGASLVVGQSNFTSSGGGRGAANLSFGPGSAAFDSSGDLWVADTGNSRILEYVPPFTSGMSATLVLGQTTLAGFRSNTSQNGLWEPEGIAFGGNGDLWVADTENDRVLEFIPPFTTGMNATLVLGQSNFTTRAAGTSSTNLTLPSGLAFNATGALFVADRANDRVVAFDPPFTDGKSAALVLGQTSFSQSGAGTTATNLSLPAAVAVDRAGDLWVADQGNNRVLEFPYPLSTGEAASAVLGQTNFTLTDEPTPDGLSSPWGIGFDAYGDLWVADSAHDRVLEYGPSPATGAKPSVVIGQSSTSGTRSGTTRWNLSAPSDPLIDPSGTLWVVDASNARVLEFAPATYSETVNETGLTNGTFWSITVGGAVGAGLAPGGIAFQLWNGSYFVSIGTVPGYSSTAPELACPVTIDGAPSSATVTFTSTPSSSPSGPTPGELELGLYVLLVVVVVLAALLVRERRKHRGGGPPPAGPGSTGSAQPPGA
jgi:sugar lactone lactonase YvrE